MHTIKRGGCFVSRPFLVAGTAGSVKLRPAQRRSYIACPPYKKQLGGWADCGSTAIGLGALRSGSLTGAPKGCRWLWRLTSRPATQTASKST